MKEIVGDLWAQPADAICVTTNGHVTTAGRAVMGRGCAKEATQKVPGIQQTLGKMIQTYGNKVTRLAIYNGKCIVAFPVKSEGEVCTVKQDNVVVHMKHQFRPGHMVPGWACKARLDIIEESCKLLVELAHLKKWTKVILPRPGCGYGELHYDDVRPILERHLDDRFYIITKPRRGKMEIDKIFCPSCQWHLPYDEPKYFPQLVTPWGENGVIIQCENCKTQFQLIEKVKRTYEFGGIE
jgi:hypothetical protein